MSLLVSSWRRWSCTTPSFRRVPRSPSSKSTPEANGLGSLIKVPRPARRHGEWNPGPPACKLAAGSPFAVAERVLGATGVSRDRLVLGSLPYFSGVRAQPSRCDSGILSAVTPMNRLSKGAATLAAAYSAAMSSHEGTWADDSPLALEIVGADAEVI